MNEVCTCRRTHDRVYGGSGTVSHEDVVFVDVVATCPIHGWEKAKEPDTVANIREAFAKNALPPTTCATVSTTGANMVDKGRWITGE